MKRLVLLIVCMLFLPLAAFGNSFTEGGPFGKNAPGVAGAITSLPIPTTQGGTGATSLGCGLSNAGSVLNTDQCPERAVNITSDTITGSDAGKVIVYNNASAIAVTSASAASGGLTAGFGVVLKNKGAGAVTWTPTASTINGASSFTVPSGTGCYAYSDNTNFQIDFGSCSSLPIATANLPVNVTYRVVGVTVDGGGSVPSTGVKGYYRVPYSGTITGYSLQSDISGSVVVDVWKRAGAIPTVGNTITASALPTLSSAQFLNNTTLTAWTTSVAAGDVIGFNVNSISTLTRLTVQLYITTN